MRTDLFLCRPRILTAALLALSLSTLALPASGRQAPLKVFISVDMEGIGGIGTAAMTSSTGKDYQTGRRLMTDEVLAVIAAIQAHRPAEILVNDSHGDMQNLLHTDLPPGVEYIQGNIKPLGMVQGLDESFDAAVFIGYHARAGTENAFLAHTGSGSVKGLWLNGTEVGEGGMNAAFAGALGVPVVLASGDETFARQFSETTGVRTVATKTAIGNQVARLIHPDEVRRRLREGIGDALSDIDDAPVFVRETPIDVRMRFATTTRADIVQAIPGMTRVDGFTVEYRASDMDEAYRLIRLMYKYISW
jgi:D-amino peptidase